MKEFISVWWESASVGDVVERLGNGLTKGRASQIASQLRKLGVRLKRMPHPQLGGKEHLSQWEKESLIRHSVACQENFSDV